MSASTVYGGGSPLSSSRSRTPLRYPSPFFDLAQHYLPQNPRSLFRFARYYAMVHGPVAAFVSKMSAYGITRLVWGGESVGETRDSKQEGDLSQKWKNFFEKDLKIYRKCLQYGIYYWTYGNAYASIMFKFDRWLGCQRCGYRQLARKFPSKRRNKHGGKKKGEPYKWRKYHFEGVCPRCGHRGRFSVHDVYRRSPKAISIKLWNPERVYVLDNEVTDETEYYYKPSPSFARRVARGDREIIEKTPLPFIQAVKKRGYVRLSNRNLIHLKCPSPNGNNQSLGVPPILAALKDAFHLQLLKRAQEANAIERTIPLDVIHPLPMGDRLMNPNTSVNLEEWIDHTREEIKKARQDPNYVPVAPMPIGSSHIWGEGKHMLMVQEIRAMTELVAVDLGVPIEFLFGGLSFTGSSVSLRMLENQILPYIGGYQDLATFAKDITARFLQWEKVPHSWTPFKMADDIQLKQHAIMMSQMNKIGDKTLLAQFDWNPQDEYADVQFSAQQQGEAQKLLMIEQAKAQAESMRIQQRVQMELQEEMQPTGPVGEMAQTGASPPAGGSPQPGMQQEQLQQAVPQQESLMDMAARMAQQLAGQPDDVVQQALNEMAQQSPDFAQYVAELVNQLRAQMQQQQTAQQQTAQQQPADVVGGTAQPEALPSPEQQMRQQMMQQQRSMMAPMPQQNPPRRGAASAVI